MEVICLFQVSDEWLKEEASRISEKILRASFTDYDAYTGASGLCYGLLRVAELIPEGRVGFFNYYKRVLEPYLKSEVVGVSSN